MSGNPLAEVFGYKTDDSSADADRHRRYRLCPFNNNVPNCGLHLRERASTI